MFFKKNKSEMNQEELASQAEAQETAQTEEKAGKKLKKDNKMAAELEAVKAELDEMKDKYLRMLAEFDNFKRRAAKERVELEKVAARNTMRALLPTLDDFDRAMKSHEAGQEVLPEGVIFLHERFANTLHQQGLRVMDSNGQTFDVELHEAMTEFPAPSEEMKGKVFDTVEKGYYLHDVIIRHAKVVVAK